VKDEHAAIDDAAYVRALAHPLRLKILAMLEEQPSSPARLAEALDSNARLVDYHVKRLSELGLVELVGMRPTRGAPEHLYAARPHPRFSDAAWDALDGEAKSAVLVTMLRQMSEYVNRSATSGGFDRPDAHFTRTPVRVDARGWDELTAAARAWLGTVARIEQDVAERAPADTFEAGVVLLVFEARPFSDEAREQP
jgi:DNA-binding transcriptional ArsR family regulator